MTGFTKRVNLQPTMSSTGNDSSVIRYNTMGINNVTDSQGNDVMRRFYIPGFSSDLSSSTGATVASFYATGKFIPGTTVKWCPNVSFNTSGRVVVGFTDNPEIAATLNSQFDIYLAGGAPAAGALTSIINAVNSLGNAQSFPVWQETMISFPTKLRRKMFDTNTNIVADANVLDRSMQVVMWAVCIGSSLTNGSIGSFQYRDVVSVEGLCSVNT